MIFPMVPQIHASGREFIFFNCNIEKKDKPVKRSAMNVPRKPTTRPTPPIQPTINFQNLDKSKMFLTIGNKRYKLVPQDPPSKTPQVNPMPSLIANVVIKSIFGEKLSIAEYLRVQVNNFCRTQPMMVLNVKKYDLFWDYTKRIHAHLHRALKDHTELQQEAIQCRAQIERSIKEKGLTQSDSYLHLVAMTAQFLRRGYVIIVDEDGRANLDLSLRQLLLKADLIGRFIDEASYAASHHKMHLTAKRFEELLASIKRFVHMARIAYGTREILNLEMSANYCAAIRNNIYRLAEGNNHYENRAAVFDNWKKLITYVNKTRTGVQKYSSQKQIYPFLVSYYEQMRNLCLDVKAILLTRYGLKTLKDECPLAI